MNTKFLTRIATILLTSVILSGLASAQQMNYQGRLTDASGNALADGIYNLRFHVYTVAASGSALWGPSDVAATLVNGRFNVILGEPDDTTLGAGGVPRKLKNAFTSSTPHYLGITLIDAVTNPTNLEIAPRQQILSSPNAMFANTAGHATTATAVGNPGETAINVLAGKVGINQATPEARLHVDGNTSDPALKVDVDGTTKLLVNTNGGTSVGGSSSAPPLNGLRVEGDAVFQGNAVVSGNVGIGTDSPAVELDVAGDVKVSDRMGVGTGPGTFNVLRLNRTIGSNDPSGKQHELQLEIRNGIGNRSLAIGVLDNGIGVIQAKEQGVGGENASFGGYQKLLLNPVAGSVGIGTVTPTKGKLVVYGGPGSEAGTYGYLRVGFVYSGGATLAADAHPVSIYAEHSVEASHILLHSDERIKRIDGRSDQVDDLATLLAIEVTDYTHIDTIGKGNRRQKKLIAQQVEKVYP
ncbi:MAG: tail fiber domain-containing protein, partial [Verrucomicrobiales bacterium]